MMKKNWNNPVAMGMAVMMILSMSACGGARDSKETKADAKSVESSGKSSEKRAEISMMLPSFSGTDLKNDHSDEVIKEYENYTNTKVDWRWENNDTYGEKFGLTLMDRDNMPMILANGGELTANVVDAAKKGAFWDLTDYLKDEKEYPNLSKADPETLKALTVDGKVIGIYRARAKGRYGMSYRKDWAEKVGITEVPKTPDDIYNMMYKFTYEDPDGNGKDDTYGLEMTKYTGPLDVIQTWFGVGNEWTKQGKRLVPVHQTKEYMESLNWMKKMYDDGLIRKVWATIDSGTFQEGCKKGEDGMFIDVMDGGKRIWEYFEKNKIPSVVDESKNASMDLVGPVNDKTLATSGFNGYFLITKAGAKTEEDMKNCLHFLDKMCDDKMLILADYGLKDITYKSNDDGNIEKIDDIPMEQTPSAGLNQALAYIPNDKASNPKLEMTDIQKKAEEVTKSNEDYAVTNPALGYLANSEVNAEVGTDIKQIIDDARTQYICGQIDEKGFKDAAKQWLDRGGDRLIEDVNKLYQEDQGK